MFEKQQLAFNKFQQLKVGALFMEMGTGKTRVALELVNYNNVDLLIYVCPFSTKNNILNEINKWKVNCDYIVIGYETIQASDSKYLELLQFMNNKKCFIIADESIFIKNDETKRFNRLCELKNKCEYALILNGTPITKNEWDLYNQMYFLSPLIINMNRNDFNNNFFTHVIYKKKGERQRDFYKFSKVNADLLYKLIEPYIFNCKLDFNNKSEINYIYVNYSEIEYRQAKEKYLICYEKNQSSDIIINMLMRLNYIASCYKNKNDQLINYIKNKRVIVFCNYLEEANYIHSNCDSFIITGDVTNRSLIIEQFKKNNKPLIMTLGTGSYSLNLQFCNEIVYSSLNFDYGLMEQSKYRIKRIGQTNNIKYTYFLADLGINKLILENLNKKKSLKDILKGELEKWIKNL